MMVDEGTNDAFSSILRWADQYKKLRVMANITASQVIWENLDLCSDGVGFLRMENMFMEGKKREVLLDYLIGNYVCPVFI